MTNLTWIQAIFFLSSILIIFFRRRETSAVNFHRPDGNFFLFLPASKINCKREKKDRKSSNMYYEANHLHLPPKFPRSHWPLRAELAGVWRSERPSEIVCGSFQIGKAGTESAVLADDDDLLLRPSRSYPHPRSLTADPSPG